MLTFKYHLRNLNSRWSVERHNIVFKLKCKMYFELTKKINKGTQPMAELNVTKYA